MKIKLAPLFAMAGLVLAGYQAQAESLIDGSADAGKARALTCTACHGVEGNSANPMWPNLAGQHAPYVAAQLQAFRDGTRQDPLMSAQSMALSDDDIANLAVYFESLPGAAQAVANPAVVENGEALYRGGNVDTGVAACMACHGPTGAGNPAAGYPALKGQHAAYTAKQLLAYADGLRETDGKTRIMRDIAARLSKEEIEAISSYVQGLK
ncbi:MAG TPA: c-type cytochrome [Woeseiaceae bacterium]